MEFFIASAITNDTDDNSSRRKTLRHMETQKQHLPVEFKSGATRVM